VQEVIAAVGAGGVCVRPMSFLRFVPVFAGLCLLAVGCDSAPYEGVLATPAAFTHRDGCIPGSIWKLPDAALYGPFASIGIRRNAHQLQISWGGDRGIAQVTANDAFLRLVTDARDDGEPEMVVVDICGVGPDGSIVAFTAFCWDGQCPVDLRPPPAQGPGIWPVHTSPPGEASMVSGLHLVGSAAIAHQPYVLPLSVGQDDTIYIPEGARVRRLRPRPDRSSADALPDLVAPSGAEARFYEARPYSDGQGSYVLTHGDELRVFDVSAGGTLVGGLPHEAKGWQQTSVAMLAGRTYAWMTSSEGLQTFDLTDPAHPVDLGTHLGDGWPDDVAVDGSTAFVVSWDVTAVDVSDPTMPEVLAGRDDNSSRSDHVAVTHVAGHRIVVSSGIELSSRQAGLDILDGDEESPTFMHALGHWSHPRPDSADLRGSHALAVHGARVYLADGLDGVRVIDISNPTEPVQLGYYRAFDFNPWTGHTDGTGSIESVEVLADGTIVAAAMNVGVLFLQLD
jgi:hypothetical protein